MQTNPLALFGDHLARLRKARGWSQEKLALESGLARSYVSGIERGRRNVALVNICVLADTLGVPTSEMLRFAQTASDAQDTAMPSERTPLPQISRSLCKLENRDQVWLAEIIRSLSSRLSHAAPPASVGVDAPHAVNTFGGVGAEGADRMPCIDDEGDEDNEYEDAMDTDGSDAALEVRDLEDMDDVEALHDAGSPRPVRPPPPLHALAPLHHLRPPQPLRPAYGTSPAHPSIEHESDADATPRHHITSPAHAMYRADDTVNAGSRAAEGMSHSRIREPDGDPRRSTGEGRSSSADGAAHDESLRLDGRDND